MGVEKPRGFSTTFCKYEKSIIGKFLYEKGATTESEFVAVWETYIQPYVSADTGHFSKERTELAFSSTISGGAKSAKGGR